MPWPLLLVNLAATAGAGLGVLGKVAYVTKIPELFKFGKAMMVPKQRTWIEINVGGKMFMTTKTTLSQPGTIFALMIESEEKAAQERFHELDEVEKEKLQEKMNKWSHKADVFRFDRDPDYFPPILNYLRTGKLIYNPGLSLKGIQEEAKFYELKELERLIRKEMLEKNPGNTKQSSSLGSSRVTKRFGEYFDE